MSVAPLSPQYSEEEFFGDVYENGHQTTSTSYTANLSPFDAVTASRLRHPQEAAMFADPNHVGSWMYGWYDPKGGGGCGSLQTYLSGDTTARLTETHRNAPGQPLPTYKERHCIRPGIYDFFVSGAAGERFMRIDYLQDAVDGAGSTIYITNTTAGVQEVTDPQTYSDANAFSDYVVHIDLTPGGFQETAHLDVENAFTDPLKGTFTDQSQPSGTSQDWFRFSTARSSSGWNLSNRGTYLARLFWDYATNRDIATNYYDSKSTAYVIRSHQFATHVTSSRDVIVGFELKRPDEDTSSTSVVTRTVTVTVNQPPQPLVNTITGPDMINVSGFYSWLAVASGGVPPYAYGAWYYYRSPGPEQQVGTGQGYQRTVTVEASPYIFRLRNLVTDQTPTTRGAKYFVEVFTPGGFAAEAGDGVRFADGSCRPRPIERDAHQAWLADLFNSNKTVVPCRLQ